MKKSLHYILKDHLGSWTTIAAAAGVLEQELSYDAWGNLFVVGLSRRGSRRKNQAAAVI